MFLFNFAIAQVACNLLRGVAKTIVGFVFDINDGCEEKRNIYLKLQQFQYLNDWWVRQE